MRNATDEFLELLRPATILGKIPGFRRVPFNTQVPVQTGGGTYKWVGQGASKPVGKLALTTIGLGFSKAAGIIVITEELAKLSSPSAEAIVRADMIAGMAAFLDQQFIDPTVALVANVEPGLASPTAPIRRRRVTIRYADLHAIASHFATNQIGLAGLTLIMSETNALTAGMAARPAGQQGVSGTRGHRRLGGRVHRDRVECGRDERHRDSAERGPLCRRGRRGDRRLARGERAHGRRRGQRRPARLRSFWQNNLVGLRAERMINWKRARPKSVFYLTDAAYVPTVAAAATAAGRTPRTPAAKA